MATIYSGTVYAIGSGTATITATTDDGGYTAKCTVTVTNSDATDNTGTTSGTSSLSVVDYSLRNSSIGAILYGVVKNNTTSGYTYIKVTYKLYDSSNTLLNSDYTYLETTTIPAGQSYPFLTYTDINISLIDHVTFTVSHNSTTNENPEKNLSVSNIQSTTNSLDEIVLTGNINNNGSSALDYCKIEFIFYDSDQNLVSMKRTYADPTTIVAGDSNTFTLYTSLEADEFSSYTTIVTSSSNY